MIFSGRILLYIPGPWVWVGLGLGLRASSQSLRSTKCLSSWRNARALSVENCGESAGVWAKLHPRVQRFVQLGSTHRLWGRLRCQNMPCTV